MEHSLRESLATHPICQVYQRSQHAWILEQLSPHIRDGEFHDWYLALHQFVKQRPLTYYREETVENVLTFLRTHANIVTRELPKLDVYLSHAIFSLLRSGSSWGREERLKLDTPADILDFEGTWHPEYQRYCEHVFNHLIKVPLAVLGIINGRDYLGMALANQVSLLASNGLASATTGYNATVRNAVSHGNVSFGLYQVLYTDRNGTVELTAMEFARRFDDLVDTCHSLLIALVLFICQERALIEATGVRVLPLGLRFLLVEALTAHPGFWVVGLSGSGHMTLNTYGTPGFGISGQVAAYQDSNRK